MPFVKGQSGNPSGKPAARAKREIAASIQCGKHVRRCVSRLARIVSRGADQSAISAANTLLAYGVGKPSQVITGAAGGPIIIRWQGETTAPLPGEASRAGEPEKPSS